ncbi:trypsin-like peptidase domain-containing protein [Streptomyces sp. NPDC086783]|uniref:nSTAND1 domain-containing NTPase n=1 Tax=Streptomyces sp. NPDC086783 TaxID=3365758 RepID=UPI003808AB5C
MTGEESQSPDEALAAAVVRIKGQDGEVGGAGFFVAPDLVLTCAHVVSDVLERSRDRPVAPGTAVTVDLPLSGPGAPEGTAGAAGADTRPGQPRPERKALVETWVPIRADRTGDLALLRLPEPLPGARPLPMADPVSVWEHGARAVGFTDGEPGESWFRGKLGGATGEGWLQLSRADGQAAHVRQGFSGTPVWDNELGAAVGLVVAAQPEQDAQQAFVLRTRTLLAELPALAPLVLPAVPFRGLAPFREEDADAFFGRDGDIADVVGALRGERPTVTLYGPSGSGKSSLALAGVVPRMRRDGYDVLVVNAGQVSSPLSALATELYEDIRSGRFGAARAHSADQVESWLADKGLADALHRARGTAGGRLLVVLDQAEALLDRTEAEVAETVRLLFPERPGGDGTRVLLTLRADLMDAVLRHPALGPAVRAGRTLPLTPMTREQLREVITRPVERVPGVAYDPGLDRRILDDTGGEPGILPLLGFVLEQLWHERAVGRLRAAAYDGMNGVTGALGLHARNAWRECVEEGSEADALRLLTGLVRVLPGGATPLRRRLTREEAGEERWRLARSFAERRLLVLHGGDQEPETAELAHETLITAWPALARQVKADGEFLAARAELAHDRERWERGGRSADLLPGAVQLGLLTGRLRDREDELTGADRDFLDQARQRQRARGRRLRAAWIAGALVLALIAGLGTFLVHQSGISERRGAEARSRALASLAGELDKRDPAKAALVAIGAYDTAPTQEARTAMLRGYDKFDGAAWVMGGVEGEIDAVSMSVDGQVALATSQLGRASLFLRSPGGKVRRLQLQLRGLAFHPLVSRDGRRIAYISTEDALVWHDVDAGADEAEDVLGRGRPVRAAEFAARAEGKGRQSDQVHFMDFSPDGSEIVTVAGGRLGVWDLRAGTRRPVSGRPPAVEAVWFGPDARTVVAQRSPQDPDGGKHTVVAIDTRTGRTRELARGVETFDMETMIRSLPAIALSGDGRVLSHCRTEKHDGTNRAVYRTVRVADGRERNRYVTEGYRCRGVAMDRTGALLAMHVYKSDWVVGGVREGDEVLPADAAEQTADIAGRLLGDARHLVVPTWDGTTVTGLSLETSDHPLRLVVAHPLLLDDARTLVAHVETRQDAMDPVGNRLALVDATTGHVRTQVARPPRDSRVDPDPPHTLAVNEAQTLVADVVGRDRIQIRRIPSLRKVAEITTRMPPADKRGKSRLSLLFLRGDELVTLSGTRIEHFDARNGRRLTKTLDARELGLPGKTPALTTSDGNPPDSGYALNRRPEPGLVQIVVRGHPRLYAVDLHTGKEVRRLRVTLGPDNDRAFLDPSGRYAAAKTKGSMVEIWSVRAGHQPTRVLGPLGPLGENDASWGDGFTLGFTGRGSEFYVATGSSVRFQDADDPSRFETYDFAEDQYFLAATRNGRTLLRVQDGKADLLTLDPSRWKRRLCDVVGRDLTDDERRGLPALPATVCPD